MTRLFIALELPVEQKKDIIALQEKSKAYLEGIRWVKPEGLHLTLKFLGETEEEKIPEIINALDLVGSRVNSFQVAYGKSGVFPSPKKARVFWVGLIKGLETINSLASDMELSMVTCGFTAEKRKFTPHLTIGRSRGTVKESLTRRFLEETKSFKTVPYPVNRILLYESKLTPRGAIYTIRHETQFLPCDNK